MTIADRPLFRFLSWGALVLAVLVLAGCGGGGDGGGTPTNTPPTASFTVTPNVGQLPFTVTVNAAASSDPGGSIASYAWTFGDGGTGSGVSTTHTYQTANTFTITLTVTDNAGATGATTRLVAATVGPPPTTVQVSGKIMFERVPFSAVGEGLEYLDTYAAPAREIEVELLPAAGGAALLTTATDGDGDYSFDAPLLTDVRVRAKAVSRFAGTPARPATWDLRVLNNTNSNALYVLDGAVFNTGVTNWTRNLTATTGWSGFAGYSGPRAAAPFAILDTLYSSAQFVIGNGGSAVQFPALSAFWSTENRAATGSPATGNIGTTLYQSAPGGGFLQGIYVLGDADDDTDEFDQHVLAHEFQHYLEDAVSRTDTVGGDHSLAELLDMRVAFSEGFSNAFSAMVMTGLVNQPEVYRDSGGVGQGDDYVIFSLENDQFPNPGWYSEGSVQRIVWDLFDSANDPADADAVSLDFGPMYDVMVDSLREGVPLTSLFSFLTAVKQQPGVSAPAVEARVASESNIVAVGMDAYATNETHDGGLDPDIVLPVYSTISLNGDSARLCTDASDIASTTSWATDASCASTCRAHARSPSQLHARARMRVARAAWRPTRTSSCRKRTACGSETCPAHEPRSSMQTWPQETMCSRFTSTVTSSPKGLHDAGAPA